MTTTPFAPTAPSSCLPRVAWVWCLVGAWLALACADRRERDLPPLQERDGGSIQLCIDEDGDGYGFGCAAGNDCDDSDPDTHNECGCDDPNVGCACDGLGQKAACGRAYAKVGEQLLCGEGITTCDGERWGECIINQAITLKPQRQLLGFGSATPCNGNPCDPQCTEFVDTPVGIGSDGGIVESDAGLTLGGGGPLPPTGPPMGGGFGCVGGDYPALNGACEHHVCEVGSVLDPTCDEALPTSTPVVLFSDSFVNHNAQGWTLDPTWAIGTVQSSSGHTTGNGDPGSAHGVDSRIAGTVLGGNIGGGGTLFFDPFPNLNAWNETGEGDWNVETLPSSWTYPIFTASGSPAAHVDNCDTSCTITLGSTIDLSGYTSATLEFLRYIDSNLDTGEYLRVDVWNGSSWVQAFNWTSPNGDDSQWRSEQLNLTPYLVDDFRVRFRVQASETNEHVYVDDVRITAPATMQTRWMTSPAFDGTLSTGPVTLSYSRWLNIEHPSSRVANVEVYNGSNWVNVWANTGAVSDNSWQTITHDLTAYKNAQMRIRFGWSGAATSQVSGWNLDEVRIDGEVQNPPDPGCVGRICAVDPTCCSDSWHSGCLALIASECQIECNRDGQTDECVACYTDPTGTVDYDGDGISPIQGDCRECDPTVNPGAYDVPNDGIDQDCDGTIDNGAVGCDGALSASGGALDHARAMGLCKVATENSWGILEARFVRADGVTPCTDTRQYRILNDYGSGNRPTEGQQMAVYSTGTARDRNDSGWVQPDGQNAYDARTSSTPAHAVPPAAGCNAGTSGFDSCGLKLKVRAPTNAHSFSYNFNFFTSEYPEYLCTAFNDAFVAYYYGELNTRANKNISFDSAGNPVSVNNGFFSVPGWPPLRAGTHPKLNGSGFDGVCPNNPGGTYRLSSICGGSTDWLITSAPVRPGEEFELHFSIWDTGDHVWDSTVLIDNFRWSSASASIVTGVYNPGSPDADQPEPFQHAWFVRDYDMSGTCNFDETAVWSLWSWAATTPEDSRVEFYVRTAMTRAGLDTAPQVPLLFSNPPGPAGLNGSPVVAQSSPVDTQVGSALVDNALAAAGQPRNYDFLRVMIHLVPSSDLFAAPVLQRWNLQTSCQDAQ